MVAQQRNVRTPANQVIISRKVGSPQEALLTEFDSVRHKEEQRHEYRCLNQHRQTSTHRAYAILTIKRHGFLLFLQSVFLLRILSVYLIYVRLQCFHLSRRDKRFPSSRNNNNLNDDSHQQDNDTHAKSPSRKPVEQVDGKPTVNPADDRPSQVYQVFQLLILVLEAQIVAGK